MTTYKNYYDSFRWSIPQYYNIGVDVVDRPAQQKPDFPALVHINRHGQSHTYSFMQMKQLSNQTANLLSAHDIAPSDRIAILLPQAPETAYAHVAIYKMGAIAVPLFTLFGVEALEYRLNNCEAKAVITDSVGAQKLAEIRDQLPLLRSVFNIDGKAHFSHPHELDFHELLKNSSSDFTPIKTLAEDPAVIIYTSGTTGQPKGALHAHRTLLGHLPGVEMSHDLMPQEGDRLWTPADWAWIGGLYDVLMPAWHHGLTVVSHRFDKFDPEKAFSLIAEHHVHNTFLPPTALKLMRAVTPNSAATKKINTGSLRSIASGGESLGEELLDWGKEVFNVSINEFYGQTECNMIVSSCASIMPTKVGRIGRAAPGHRIGIVDTEGNELPRGKVGNIAAYRYAWGHLEIPDPVMFLEYWKNPQATTDKFCGTKSEWMLTGDQGSMDDEGYITFLGRDDDVINSAGYRIGPSEIENCLLGHPSVELAAVIGVPDELRGQIIKAYIVLKSDFAANDVLRSDLQTYVKTRLSAHEYPRALRFVESLPTTNTGKIMRRILRDWHDQETQ